MERRSKRYSGERFGRFVLIEFSHRVAGNYYWKCKCDCGKIKIVFVSSLVCGDVKSCGCFQKEYMSKRQRRYSPEKSVEISKELEKKRRKNARKNILEWYVKRLLFQSGIINPTKEQIEQRRLSLKLKRKINEIQRKIKSPRNHGRTDNVLQGTDSDRGS